MIAIIDYGMGNLRSVQKALEKNGADARIVSTAGDLEKADKIILPGVGAIQPAMERLTELKLIPAIENAIQANKPFLGICLGLQLLFDESDEGGKAKGIGIFPGRVKRFTSLKVPHMGWNQLNIRQTGCPLLKNIPDGTNAYFCHSYYVQPNAPGLALTTTDYGIEFVSAICRNNTFGVQFHPEKSQTAGLQILKNFSELAA